MESILQIRDECRKIEKVKVEKLTKEKQENNKLEDLKAKLKDLIKEEKYEEAAKIRDEIAKKNK